jgi:hypothetical protein
MKLTTNFDCNGWGAEAKAHFNYTGKYSNLHTDHIDKIHKPSK